MTEQEETEIATRREAIADAIIDGLEISDIDCSIADLLMALELVILKILLRVPSNDRDIAIELVQKQFALIFDALSEGRAEEMTKH
jgi:hypothetical protein